MFLSEDFVQQLGLEKRALEQHTKYTRAMQNQVPTIFTPEDEIEEMLNSRRDDGRSGSTDETRDGDDEAEGDREAKASSARAATSRSAPIFSPSPEARALVAAISQTSHGKLSGQQAKDNVSKGDRIAKVAPLPKLYNPLPPSQNADPVSAPSARSSSPTPSSQRSQQEPVPHTEFTPDPAAAYAWNEHISHSEVLAVFNDPKNSQSVGVDNIPYSPVVALWPLVGDQIVNLYRRCLALGNHPTAWEESLTMVLRKPHKPSYRQPNVFRPIALLSCLGKGLKKIVACWLAWITERFHLLPQEHFGGRAGRSSEDALTLFVDAIKLRWREKQTNAAVLFDVKSAFPSIKADRLVQNLHDRHVPAPIIAFVSSFMAERSVQILLGNIRSESFSADGCGLPQGSPLSPILFFFYNAGLLTSLRSDQSMSIGWIDDVTILVWRKTKEDVAEAANEAMRKVKTWSASHSAQMDPNKSHVLELTQRKEDALDPPIRLLDTTIPRSETATLLGVRLDDKLRFHAHVAGSAERGSAALNALRALSGSRRGISARYIRQAVIACVHPRLDYALTVWYKPGQTKDLVATLERINAEAAKLVTGLPRSASGAAAEVETNLQPTHLRLAHRSHNAATRLLSAPQEHPLRRRFLEAAALTFPRRPSCATHATPLDQLAHAFPDLRNEDGHLVVCETIQLVDPFPPWDKFEPPETSIAELKDDAAEKHNQLIASLEPEDVVAYSDGSMMEGCTGHALGTQQTVYGAELDGIALAMRMLLHAPAASRNRRIVICVDNQAAVRVATSTRPGPGQAQRIKIRRLYLELKEKLEPTSIKLQWVPGHVEIDGKELTNEAVKEATKATDDELIKQGLEIERPNTIPASRTTLRQQFKTRISQVWATEWKNGKTGAQLRKLDDSPPGPSHFKLYHGLPRWAASLLAQLRTRRSPLAHDLFRRRLHPTGLCGCGAAETLEHVVLSCKQYERQRRALQRGMKEDLPPDDIRLYISNVAASRLLIAFFASTGMCPGYEVLLARETSPDTATKETGANASGCKAPLRLRLTTTSSQPKRPQALLARGAMGAS
ncbi:BQ2448_2358 [Microbotryum intermedium]|uniref:BQ2448_2358 protein n=1 Tax=Microbotryum intermedium TaxID=269621 RepID=A0A238FDX7_9BASI|nr:BQ2448_2358 [Microbotryum intermedium]